MATASVHPFPKSKKNKAKSGSSPSRPARKDYRVSRIPVAEQMAIIERWLTGGPQNSIRQLAIDFNRDESTVSRVVKSDLGKRFEEALIQAQINYIRDVVAPKAPERLEYEIGNRKSKMGAIFAFEILERKGVIPPKILRQQNLNLNLEEQAKEIPEDDRVRKIVENMSQLAMETRIAFAQPLPDMEELAVQRKRTIDVPLVEKK